MFGSTTSRKNLLIGTNIFKMDKKVLNKKIYTIKIYFEIKLLIAILKDQYGKYENY